MKKTVMSIYLFMLCGTAFGVFILGVFVAPVIFSHEKFLHIALYNRFEAGLLMTTVFQRFNIVLAICGLMIIAVEGIAIVQKQFFKTTIIFALFSLIEIAMFLFYFTPAILAFQAQGEGAINSTEFLSIHMLAEFDFKALLLTLTMLAFFRFSRAIKDEPCGCDEESAK
jgi:hypothetical protein